MQLLDYLADTGKTITDFASESGWFDDLDEQGRNTLITRIWRHANGKRRPSPEDIDRYEVATKKAVTATDWQELARRAANEEAEPPRRAAAAG